MKLTNFFFFFVSSLRNSFFFFTIIKCEGLWRPTLTFTASNVVNFNKRQLSLPSLHSSLPHAKYPQTNSIHGVIQHIIPDVQSSVQHHCFNKNESWPVLLNTLSVSCSSKGWRLTNRQQRKLLPLRSERRSFPSSTVPKVGERDWTTGLNLDLRCGNLVYLIVLNLFKLLWDNSK